MTKPDNEQLPEDYPITIDVILNSLRAAREQSVAKTGAYRLFLKLKEEPALYYNPIVCAAIISKGFQGIGDDVSDKVLGEIAKLTIGLFNDTYSTILKDVGDEGVANLVFRELIRKN